jgi:pullulanase/glycogen debranching enzyme
LRYEKRTNLEVILDVIFNRTNLEVILDVIFNKVHCERCALQVLEENLKIDRTKVDFLVFYVKVMK